MIEISLEALATADESLNRVIKAMRAKALTTDQMAQKPFTGPEGWSPERQVVTMSILLATAIQRLVMQDVMAHDE
jgi:hypothetical protein